MGSLSHANEATHSLGGGAHVLFRRVGGMVYAINQRCGPGAAGVRDKGEVWRP